MSHRLWFVTHAWFTQNYITTLVGAVPVRETPVDNNSCLQIVMTMHGRALAGIQLHQPGTARASGRISHPS